MTKMDCDYTTIDGLKLTLWFKYRTLQRKKQELEETKVQMGLEDLGDLIYFLKKDIQQIEELITEHK